MLAGLSAWLLSGVIAAHGLTRRAQARVTEEIAPPGWRGLRLTAEDGVTLGAWWSAEVDAPIGVVVAHASVRRLDTLRQLRPPAVVVVDVSTIVVVAVGSVLAVAALALLTVVSTIRARPLEVMRGTA